MGFQSFRPPVLRLTLLILLAAWANPAAAATIVVTGTGDTVAVDGVVTLREAVVSINNGADVNADVAAVGTYGTNDTIQFSIPGPGVRTIQPTSPMKVTKPVSIDGYTQPGSRPNSLDDSDDSIHLIEIDCSLSGEAVTGVLEIAGGNSAVRGLVLTFGMGASALLGVTGNGSTLTGNFIGTDPTGRIDHGSQCYGLRIQAGGNTVGGPDPGERNVISGATGCGINLLIDGGSGNQVLNNYFGTNAAGTLSIQGPGQAFGIMIQNASNNTIGGSTPGTGNLIAGNDLGGIVLIGAASSGNLLQNNQIGVNKFGLYFIQNSDGVRLTEGAHDNVIGGTLVGRANAIAFNTRKGVTLTSTAGSNNLIAVNSIFSNGGLGIDLNDDGPTANDSGDPDTGPNNLQNYPIITSVVAAGVGSVTIEGTLNSTPNTTFRIELFASAFCNSSGYGAGASFVGATSATTDGSGSGAFSVSLSVVASSILTATATDPSNNTSEFSPCFAAPLSFFTLTPCRIIDTRNLEGPYGGPALQDNGSPRDFVLAGQCGIPAEARAVSVMIAVTQPQNGPGFMTIYPGGTIRPLASTMNYKAGKSRANNAIVPLGGSGDALVYVNQGGGTVHFVLDVNGYFE